MLNIEIISIGKLKEKFWRDACDEYAKRLSAFCKFKITELSECKASNNPSQSELKQIINTEGERIIEKIPKNAKVISMCIEGKQLSSEKLSEKINQLSVDGTSSIVFIIGGSWGLSDDVKRISDIRLSMSAMTFPHQLARVMLCEQIYRSFQILSGGKYHK